MNKKKRIKEKEIKRYGLFSPVTLGIYIFVLFLLLSPIIFISDFFAYWNNGNGPFFIIFMRAVYIPGIWGGVSLIAGVLIAISTTYMILTKKAFNPKALILPAVLLTILTLGMAYAFLGIDWITNVSDAKTYVVQGAEEKVIVLKKYEIKEYYGQVSAPTDYFYKTDKGETYSTQTRFKFDIVVGDSYKITYLPKTKYIIGMEKLD
jgi:hypothetical protein